LIQNEFLVMGCFKCNSSFPYYYNQAMDFSLTPKLEGLRDQTRSFIRDQIIPYEKDVRQNAHGPSEELRKELMTLARKAGLLAPHASVEMGGLGLSHVEKALVFEEAGYSSLGPIAMNIHAPDEGNIHLLEEIATPEQKERWLRPLVAGEIRSCFAMTEPSPGAGSDPSMLMTTAKKDGDDYLINGQKWFITGADGADFVIIMARGEDGSATMFLSNMNARGIELVRNMDAMDSCFVGGHGVLQFTNLRVSSKQILGELGKGFKNAQVRLAPARLTHCMRWLGQAQRAQDIAITYAKKREAFGKTLGEHEGVGFMLADNDMDLQTSRLNIWHTAWLLDQGRHCNFESSRAKVICSEAEWRVVDRCVQMLGGQGVTGETALMKIFKDMRGFRIYDGPSEVHRWSMARKMLANKELK
jgi:acyl-CoA dehydrogenase